jgi:hypothetical protein
MAEHGGEASASTSTDSIQFNSITCFRVVIIAYKFNSIQFKYLFQRGDHRLDSSKRSDLSDAPEDPQQPEWPQSLALHALPRRKIFRDCAQKDDEFEAVILWTSQPTGFFPHEANRDAADQHLDKRDGQAPEIKVHQDVAAVGWHPDSILWIR